MKKFILIVFIIGVIASVATGFSIMFLEEGPVRIDIGEKAVEDFAEGAGIKYQKDQTFDEPIKEIYLPNLNGSLVLEKGSTDKIEIKEKPGWNISYTFEDGRLCIEEEGSDKNSGISININGGEDYNTIKITCSDPEDISFKVDSVNGALSIKNRLKSMAVDKVNGSLSLKADQSFDLSLGKVNGQAIIKMDKIDARVKVGKVNGAMELPCRVRTDVFSDEPTDETIGSGRDTIEIGKVNGLVTIKK